MTLKNLRLSSAAACLSLLAACAQRSLQRPDVETSFYSPGPESAVYPLRDPVDTLPVETHSPTPKVSRLSALSTRLPAPQTHSPTLRSVTPPKPLPPPPVASRPQGSSRPAPAQTPRPLPQHGRKTLVVGDSLLAGDLGSALAKSLSQYDNEACVLSVSGSRYDEWTNSTLKNRYGANQRYAKNGQASQQYARKLSHAEVAEMSLSSAIDAPNAVGCGERKFDSLVVCLGANHSPSAQKPRESFNAYIDEVIRIATEKNIPREQIRFILPPGKKYKPHYYREANQGASEYLASLGLPAPYDSTDSPRVPDESFNIPGDPKNIDHFYGSNAERTWADNLSRYLTFSPAPYTVDSSKGSAHSPVDGAI